MRTDEERLERRLIAEAQTVQLGVLIHKDVRNRREAQRCRVEVTYGDYLDEEPGRLEQHSGYYLVYVPEIAPEDLSDDEALAAHPATLATDKVHEWVQDNRGYDYFSVDDVYPA